MSRGRRMKRVGRSTSVSAALPRFGVSMSTRQKAWIDEQASLRGVSKAEVVRELLHRGLTSGPVPGGRGVSSPRGESPGSTLPITMVGDMAPDGFEGPHGGNGGVHDVDGRPAPPLTPVVEDADGVVVDDADTRRGGRLPRSVRGSVDMSAYAGDSPAPAYPDDLPPGVGRHVVFPVEEAPGAPGAGSEHDRGPSASESPAEGDAVGEPSSDGGSPSSPGEATSSAMVVAADAFAGDGWVTVLIPGMGPVRMPAAQAAGLSARMSGSAAALKSRFVRVALALFLSAAVVLGFLQLGSAVVAGRYEFREVAIAPGRSVFYRVDRWTGEMTRCRVEIGSTGVSC